MARVTRKVRDHRESTKASAESDFQCTTERTGLDDATADQLTLLTLTQAQQQQALTLAMDRNLVANAAAILTMGVAQINAAMLHQQTSLGVVAATALNEIMKVQQAALAASLNAATKK
jgi:hypothetical protein